MRVLVLTILTLFSMEAMAGKLYYSENERTPREKLTTVTSVQLVSANNKDSAHLIIQDSSGKTCLSLSSDLKADSSHMHILHQTIINLMNSKSTDNETISILFCDSASGFNGKISLTTKVVTKEQK